MAEHDLVVIGSGPGGYRAAVLAALRGADVGIVEQGIWGGCCLNRGCVPKKDWYHTARLVAASRDFAERGMSGSLRADMGGAWHHQRKVVDTVRQSYLDYLKHLGVSRYEGHARMRDATSVDVDGTVLSARNLILATGGKPAIPEGITPEPGRILTSDMLFEEEPPAGERVAIIGGGVIGTEFAFIFPMLGKSVTWLVGSEPLRRADFTPQARKALTAALGRYGIEARTGDRIRRAEPAGDGVRITLASGASIEADWACLGTGRIPQTADLGLDNAGIATDSEGFIQRNEYLETSAAGVYAIGDCASPQMTANQALADASIAVGNILDGNRHRHEPAWVPEVVYSAVELARVGLNEEQAEDAGYEPAVGFAAFETSPAALGQDDTDGFVRLIGDMDEGTLLGGEIVGAEAGELIQLIALAPDRETAFRWLAEGRFNHPARAEEILNATETLASKWGLTDQIFG